MEEASILRHWNLCLKRGQIGPEFSLRNSEIFPQILNLSAAIFGLIENQYPESSNRRNSSVDNH